ncbi:nitrate/nitrite transporter [Fontibacillus panacisegetis]|nr:nitrate/nitrite transporter [Fontibacillus panacisegetis]
MAKKFQLPLQTFNLILGFMVWVILSSLLSYIKQDIPIPADRLALVTAIPVVLGSILRIPFGYYANVIGSRLVFMISFILLLFPVYYISEANSLSDLIIGGIFLGIGGAVFSVGVTSIPKYFPKEKHGLVNGIYGLGNAGTAISTFAAPVLADRYGWSTTIKLYLILLLVFVVINFFLGDRKEKRMKTPLMKEIKAVYKNEKLWLFSMFYFITFGLFVALTVFLPNFLVTNFELTRVDAGIRTAGFIVLCTLMRPVGGWLGDKFKPNYLLMIVFAGLTLSSILLAFSPSIRLYTVGCLSIALCAGIGNGVIFKLVPQYFSKQAGTVNGIVSMMGGLGGFFPPLILSAIHSITGQYSIGFMALSQVALASLILVLWMHYTDKLKVSDEVFRSTGQGILVTDAAGVIKSINPAFTVLTGLTEKEALNQKPSILKSGKQSRAFYDEMWNNIRTSGQWQGEIWNRRKNGEEYLQLLTINTVRDESGDVVRYVGSFSDITPHN